MASVCCIERLHEFVLKEDYSGALEVLKKVQKETHEESTQKSLFSYALYLHLQLKQYHQACYLYETSSDLLKRLETSCLYYAYALYKLGFFLKCLGVVQDGRRVLRKSPPAQHLLRISCSSLLHGDVHDERLAFLEAQILYRLGLYKESFMLYHQLCKVRPSEFLHINLEACRSFVEEQDECLEDLDCYELVYNRACTTLSRKQLNKAEELLDTALEMCCVPHQDATALDEDQKRDIFLIKGQIGYLNQLRGFHEEALETYREIDQVAKDLDPSIRLAVQNNLATLKGAWSDLPILRGYPQWLGITLSSCCTSHEGGIETISRSRHSKARGWSTFKLTSHQFFGLIENYCIALLESKKFQDCEEYLSNFLFNVPTLTPLMALAQERQGKTLIASKTFFRVGEKRLPQQVEFFIAGLMLLVKVKLIKEFERFLGCISLESFVQWNATPQVLYHLLRLIGFVTPKTKGRFILQAKQFIDAYHGTPITFHATFALGQFFIQNREFVYAVRFFDLAGEAPDSPPGDVLLAAKIQAFCHYDLSKAQELLQILKTREASILPLCRQVEIDADHVEQRVLEQRFFSTKSSIAVAYQKHMTESLFLRPMLDLFRNEEGEKLHPVSKRCRKRPRYPKHIDPSNFSATLPDPERWLPKRERSGTKAHRKNHGRTARSSQGTTKAGVSTTMDLNYKKASSTNVEVQRDSKRRVK